MSVRVAVFASGGGTNLQALLDHFEDPGRGAKIALVVSDRPGVGALQRAERAGVEARVIPVSGRASEAVAEETLAALADAGAGVVALAGYLRLVPPAVVRRFAGRIVNVHPALLPAFGGRGMYGAHVHRAVLASGARVSGPTVHLVDERYDEGRILAQWPVPVLAGDTPETLAARVLAAEHALYPATVEWLARRVAEDGTGRGLPGADRPAGADPSFAWMEGGGTAVSGVRRMLGLD